jgi:hypothetical protein
MGGALRAHAAFVLQGWVRRWLARRRAEEARVAAEFNATAQRGSSLQELIEAIRHELGLGDEARRPRAVLDAAHTFLVLPAPGPGVSMLEQARRAALELGLTIDTGASTSDAMKVELTRLRAALHDVHSREDQLLQDQVETDRQFAPPQPDMLLWEKEDEGSSAWWHEGVSGGARTAPPSLAARTEGFLVNANGWLVPHNGWKATHLPPELRPLTRVPRAFKPAELDFFLRNAALRLSGRTTEIDTLALLAALADLGLAPGEHKPFLRACQWLLIKSGRPDVDPARMALLLAPFGFANVQINLVFKVVEWAWAERARLLQTAAARTAKEQARRDEHNELRDRAAAESLALARVERALGDLNNRSADDILAEEVPSHCHFCTTYKVHALCTRFTERIGASISETMMRPTPAGAQAAIPRPGVTQAGDGQLQQVRLRRERRAGPRGVRAGVQGAAPGAERAAG